MDYNVTNYGMTGYKAPKWNELSVGHKVLMAISYAIGLLLVVSMFTKAAGHAVIPSTYTMMAVSALAIFQTVIEWDRNRTSAHLWMAVAMMDTIMLTLNAFA